MAWLPKKLVVVPIDFSGKSVDAITTALEFVEDPVSVHVVHVLVPLGNMSPGVVWGTIDDASREKAVREYFDKFLTEHGQTGVTTHVDIGDPGLKITEYAIETGADLIVLPSHGYHGVKRVLMGSVAERIIRHAECPVLVLRRPDAS